jgi:methylase of polypeptide subunit release factors
MDHFENKYLINMSYNNYKQNIELRNQRLISKLEHAVEPEIVDFDDYQIIVNPGVFNPAWGEGSRILSMVKQFFVGDVLEVGTGSGALAILAAERADKVVATDISLDAVNCAIENVKKYHLEHKVSVRHGSVFTPLAATEQFDTIFINPPFLDGEVRKMIDRSYYDQNYIVLEDFFAGVKKHLKPTGNIYLCFGGVGDVGYLNYLIHINQLQAQFVYSEYMNNLNFFVYKIK